MKNLLNILRLLSLALIMQVSTLHAADVSFEIDKLLDEASFNGAILVHKNDELVYEKYKGYADAGQKVALEEQHIFSPGSVGKEFTTLGIMLLENKGLLSYDDRVSKYLDFLPGWAEKVTVFQLMNHSSSFPRIKWHAKITTQDAILQIQHSENTFEPGKGYVYSNLNVVLRALLIEKLTNTRFADFLKENIFKPAEMTTAYLQLTEADVSKDKVVGDYSTFLNGVTIYLSPKDLMRFEQALTNNTFIPLTELTSSLEGKEMSGKANRAVLDFGSYNKNDAGKISSWKHDGSNPSHHTLKYHDFDRGIIMVIMSSDGNKSTLYQIKDKLIENIKYRKN